MCIHTPTKKELVTKANQSQITVLHDDAFPRVLD